MVKKTNNNRNKIWNSLLTMLCVISMLITGVFSATPMTAMAADTYTITLDQQGGNGGDESVQATYQQDMPAVIIPTLTGYGFQGYYTNTNGSGEQFYDNSGNGVKPWAYKADRTLYAYWIANTYTITFEKDGAREGSGQSSAQVTYNETPNDISIPVRPGYDFGGYYTEQDGAGIQYYNQTGSAVKTWDIDNDTVLYAKWTPHSFQLTLDKQGGADGSAAVNVTYESPMETVSVPTKDGFDFVGYFAETEGSGKQYYDAAGISLEDWDRDEAATLYAYWTPHKYTITLNNDGGTGTVDAVEVAFGDDLPSVEIPEKEDHSFQGYYSEQNGEGTQYYTKKGIGTREWDINQDATLYASWSEQEYSVSFELQGGQAGTREVFVTYNADMPDITIPVKAGYTFNGFYTEPNGAGIQFYANDGTSDKKWEEKSNGLLYAYWTQNTYSVTMNPQGGTGGTQSIDPVFGEELPEITLPTKDNSLFAGYYDAATGGKRYYDSQGQGIRPWDKADNTTLYARWFRNAETITDPGVTTATSSDNGKALTLTKPDKQNHISIMKTDMATGEVLSGITFRAETTSTGAYSAVFSEEKTTDANGIATWNNLPDGNYNIVEANTTSGYILNTDTTSFTVFNGHVYLMDETDVTGVDVAMEIENQRNTLRLYKYDAENPNIAIEGTVFAIDGQEYTTDADGSITLLKNLGAGTHTVQEIKPSKFRTNEDLEQEYVLDPTVYSFTINPNGTVICDDPFTYNATEHVIECTFYNQKPALPGRVKITKVSEEINGQMKYLPGAKFTLYDENDDEVETKTTNKNGILVFEDMYPGVYTIREVAAPDGYYADPMFEQVVEITEDDAACTNAYTTDPKYREFSYEFDVVNKRNHYTIRKVDGKTGEPLQGAKFEIYSNDFNSDVSIAEDNIGRDIINHSIVESDGAGRIDLYCLKDGEYSYVETEAPPNYVLHNDEEGNPIIYTFTVKDGKILGDGATAGYELESQEIINMNGYNISVFLSKKDANGEEELKNAVFEIYQWDESYYDPNEDIHGRFDEKSPIATIEYREEAREASNHKEYNYYTLHAIEHTEQNKGRFLIREVSTNEGYYANWEREFAIDTLSNITDQEVIFDAVAGGEDSTVYNTRNELIVKKLDNTTSRVLTGATFQLKEYIRPEDSAIYDESTLYSETKTVNTTTGADAQHGIGTATFSHLASGNYVLTEIAAPNNYIVKDDDPRYFIVDEEGKIVEAELSGNDSGAALVPKAGKAPAGVVEYAFRDDYTTFHLTKMNEEQERLASAQFQFRVGKRQTNQKLKYKDAGTFVGYLAVLQDQNGNWITNPATGEYITIGTKVGGYDPVADVDENGIKVYADDIIQTSSQYPENAASENDILLRAGEIELHMMVDGIWEYTETAVESPYIVPSVTVDGETIYLSHTFTVDKYISDDRHEPSVRLDVAVVNGETEPIYRNVEFYIEKVDGDTGERIPNVTFSVYEYNAFSKADNEEDRYEYLTDLIPDPEKGDGYYKTSGDGVAATDKNDNGKFLIKEESNENGYVSDWEMYIDSYADGEKTVYQLYGDDAIKNYKSTLNIRKIEAGSRRPLANSVIEVWTSEETDDIIGYLEDETPVRNHQQFITDSTGYITIKNLISERSYYAQEIQAPSGFGLNNKIWEAVVNEKGYVYAVEDLPEPYDVVVESDGTYVLTLYDEETGEPVPDAWVEIWKDGAENDAVIGKYTTTDNTGDDDDGNPIIVDVQKDVINHKRYKTDENGQIRLSNLDVNGTYQYYNVAEVELGGSCLIEILNSMILTTGGAGRTLILVIGGVALVAIIVAYIVISKRKKKQNVEKK